MVRHAKYSDLFHGMLRAHRIVMLAVMWAALAACAVGALAFDVADWLSALRDVSFSVPPSIGAVAVPFWP